MKLGKESKTRAVQARLIYSSRKNDWRIFGSKELLDSRHLYIDRLIALPVRW